MCVCVCARARAILHLKIHTYTHHKHTKKCMKKISDQNKIACNALHGFVECRKIFLTQYPAPSYIPYMHTHAHTHTHKHTHQQQLTAQNYSITSAHHWPTIITQYAYSQASIISCLLTVHWPLWYYYVNTMTEHSSRQRSTFLRLTNYENVSFSGYRRVGICLWRQPGSGDQDQVVGVLLMYL